MPFQLAALAAAAMWATDGLVASGPATRLGGPRFARIRMIFVSIIFAAVTTATGQWFFSSSAVALLAVSGLVGMLVGDAALFTAYSKIGPRRTSMLFTTNAPMAAIMGMVFFGERFTAWSGLGAVTTLVGVFLAIHYGSSASTSNAYEQVRGSLAAGVGWGLLGAFGQAGGAILAKPVVEDVSALGAGTWRALVATVALWALAPQMDRIAGSQDGAVLTQRDVGLSLVSAVVSQVLGLTLLLYALGRGDAGVVTILLATTPVLILPILWLVTDDRPAIGAWIGALVTVVGAALLVGW